LIFLALFFWFVTPEKVSFERVNACELNFAQLRLELGFFQNGKGARISQRMLHS